MTSKKTKSYTIKMLEDQDDREDPKTTEDTETDESETETTETDESESEDTESMFEDSNVIEVTDKDFDLDRDEVVVFKKRKPSYVMVYSSSCPHCQNKKELYSKLAKKLTKNGKKEPEVLVLAINVKDKKTEKLQEKLDISGVPSFFETNEEGKLAELEEPLEVLNRSLKMKPEEVLDYRRQNWSDPSARQDTPNEIQDTPSDTPSDSSDTPSGSSDTPSDSSGSLESIGLPSFPSEPIKRPGFDFFGKEQRTIPLSEMSGPPLVEALRAKSGTSQVPNESNESSSEAPYESESSSESLPNNAQQLGGAKRNIKKILQQLSTKDLQILSKEFNRTGGRNKDEIIHRLLN